MSKWTHTFAITSGSGRPLLRERAAIVLTVECKGPGVRGAPMLDRKCTWMINTW